MVYSVTPIPNEEGQTGAMLVVQDTTSVQRADRQILAEARRRTWAATCDEPWSARLSIPTST
jgi:hypothetical protein